MREDEKGNQILDYLIESIRICEIRIMPTNSAKPLVAYQTGLKKEKKVFQVFPEVFHQLLRFILLPAS
jgi:hypothetical protein